MTADGDGAAGPSERARAAVIAAHGNAVRETLARADRVAADPAAPTSNGRALAAALERELEAADLPARYLDLLETAVAAAGLSHAADPVAAPPYVTVTSRGPVLRAPTDGGRLVATLAAFDVERDPVRYVRGPDTPAGALSVAIRD